MIYLPFLVGGIIIGGLVTLVTMGLGITILVLVSKRRGYFRWGIYTVLLLLFIGLFGFGVNQFVLEEDTIGGGVNEITTRNMFRGAIGFCAVPGTAIFLASLVVLMFPKKRTIVDGASGV